MKIVQIDNSNTSLLTGVAADVFDHEISLEHLASFVAQGNHILLVALNKGEVVGQARGIVHHQPDAGPELYVDNLGVTPQWKRTGIATKLMNRLMEIAKKHGCADMWLATEPENEEAIGFYRSFGMSKSTMELFSDFPKQ